jgi:hypothetical protein
MADLDLARDNLDAFVRAQLTFTRPDPATDRGESALGIWAGSHDRLMPALVATRRLDMGTDRMKFFRRIAFNGDGLCFVLVNVDGRIVIPKARVVMVEGSGHPATLVLPRGTSGRWISLEIVGQTLPESCTIHFDPTT